MKLSESNVPDPERILMALHKLTAHGHISLSDFRQITSEYPELVTSSAVTIVRALVLIQDSEVAKATFNQIAEILERALVVDIDQALSERLQHLSSERRQARFDQVRQQKRERWLHGNLVNSSSSAVPQGWKAFPSLWKCTEYIKLNYPQELIRLPARSNVGPPDSTPFNGEVPKYFFRGESGIFPTTLPSIHRLRTDLEFPLDALETILRVTYWLSSNLQKKWRIPVLLTEGLLQHYGMPTDYLDLTCDLDVAVCFATDLTIGQHGAIGVFQAEKLPQFGKVVDLRNLAFAVRPSRQRAFGFAKDENPDLKNPENIQQLDIHWFSFEFTKEDTERFNPNPELLDAHSDRAAGLLELIINGYGKMHDAAARWIANRLQPAPFTLIRRKVGGKDTWIWVSAEEAGVPYDEILSRKDSYEFWSDKFPSPKRKQLPPELLTSLTELDNSSLGATLTVVGSDLLEFLSPDFLTLGLWDPMDSSGASGSLPPQPPATDH